MPEELPADEQRPNRDGTRRSLAFVVNNYPPKVGGVELHVSALAQELAAEGHQVTVVTLDNGHPGAFEHGVEVIRMPSTRTIGGVLAFPFPGARARIAQLLKERGVEVVSTHTRFFPMSFVGVRAAKSLGVPSVHTEHGSDYVRGVSAFVGLASRMVDWTLGRLVLRGADCILGISSASAGFVRRLARRDAEVFHNAIDTGFFAEGAVWGATPQRLVFLGRLVKGKGWERAFAVAEELLPAHSDLTVHFIGDGAERAALTAAVARSAHSTRYTVHGYLEPVRIRSILAGSILLNPTELAEGFQTTLLEAVAAGASIVSTPVAAAAYLHEAGAPVRMVAASDGAGWNAAAEEFLGKPPAPVSADLLESMDWKGRGRDFIDIVSKLGAA